ncbi:hypothetical protein [Streptomyces sp. NPDC056683]|uniref:hypothetical protein n=1 Tax=Streptomyces sp. NPDC056683 TaxID=3345910 RepID=UPI00367791F3
MQSLPTPCPADLIPDATGVDAFSTVCKQAELQHAVCIAIEHQGPQWTVKADALTAPQHRIETAVYDAYARPSSA